MPDTRDIPFASPTTGPDEIEAVGRALRAGEVRAGGPISERVERMLVGATGASFALLVPNLSSAVHLTFSALGVRPGSEVVMSCLSSPRLANAVVALGARPVFCDIDPETLNVDPDDLARRVTAKTRAIVAGHEAGVASDLGALQEVAGGYALALVEDATVGMGAAWMGRHVGSIGHAGWVSFEEDTPLAAGAGAAFLTSNRECFMRAFALRSPERSLESPADAGLAPTWNGPGGGYALSDVLAAVLEAQVGRMREILRSLRRTWRRYDEAFADLEALGIARPHVPRHATSNHGAYTLRLDSPDLCAALQAQLSDAGIETRGLAQPLHLSAYAQRALGAQPSLPHAEWAAACSLRLPLFVGVSKIQAERVVDEVRRIAMSVSPATLAPPSGKRTSDEGSILPTR